MMRLYLYEIKNQNSFFDLNHDPEELYDTYEKNSKPVIEFYQHSGLLRVVNGERSITEINSEISALIEAI